MAVNKNSTFTGVMSPEALKSMAKTQGKDEYLKNKYVKLYEDEKVRQKQTSEKKSNPVMSAGALKSMAKMQGKDDYIKNKYPSSGLLSDNQPTYKENTVIKNLGSPTYNHSKSQKSSQEQNDTKTYVGGYSSGDIDILSRLKTRIDDAKKNSGVPGSVPGAVNYDYKPKSVIYKNAKNENDAYLIKNGIYVPDSIDADEKTLYKMALSFKCSLGDTDIKFRSDYEKNHNMIDQARNLKAYIAQYSASGKKLPEGFDVLKQQLDNIDKDYKKTLESVEPLIENKTQIRATRPGEVRDPTVGEWLGESILSGMNSFNSSLFKTLDFILPTEAIGQFLFGDEYQDLFSDLADYYSGVQKYYSDKIRTDAHRLGEFEEKLTPLIESTVAALPHAVLTMMSGGASLASSGNLLGGVGKGAIRTVISNFAKNPSFWLSAAQTMGNEYETAINAGANEFVASSYAILSSLINAGVEVGGGIDKLAEKIKGGNGTKLLDWVISSAAEGGEEFVQGVVSNSLAKVMYDPDVKTFSMTPGEKAIFNVPDSVEEVKAGAFVGGILGGGQVAIDTVARNISSVTNADISNIYNNQTLNEMLKNKELDRRTALAINNLGKRMGSNVIFTEYLIDEHGNFANATLSGDGKTMFISRHSTDPLVVAAFHESVHYLKKADIDTYNSIVSDMKEYALNDDEYRNSHAGIVKNIEEKSYSDYMSGDAQKDADFIEEEFTSSALSYLFSDAKNVKKFAQENFNGFQRVVDNVIHVFEKNISMYEGRDKSVRDMYEPIIDKLKEQKKSIIQRYDDGISGTANEYAGVDKYSIKFDKYGKKYWMIESENDIFKDISNLKELRKAAYDYILHGEKGELVDEIIDGSPLTFIRTSAEEYVYGSAGNPLSRTNYRQKMRMAPSILDLIENANVSYHTNDHKNHKIARDGFENYRGRVRIDNVIFNYIVRVGNADSRYTFYDINLEVESILPSTEVRQEYNKNDSTSTDIISNPGKNVNKKFSLPQGQKIDMKMNAFSRYVVCKDKRMHIPLYADDVINVSEDTEADLEDFSNLEDVAKNNVSVIWEKILSEFNVSDSESIAGISDIYIDDFTYSSNGSTYSSSESVDNSSRITKNAFNAFSSLFPDIMKNSIGIKSFKRGRYDHYLFVSCFQYGLYFVPLTLDIQKNNSSESDFTLDINAFFNAYYFPPSDNPYNNNDMTIDISELYLAGEKSNLFFDNLKDMILAGKNRSVRIESPKNLTKKHIEETEIEEDDYSDYNSNSVYIPNKYDEEVSGVENVSERIPSIQWKNSITKMDFSPKNKTDNVTDPADNGQDPVEKILHRAGNRYGISDLSQDELSGVSLSQKDIDARLGREFAFDNDIRVQSQYRDGFNNSLHLSDSVIFRYGDGSDASFGTGRILGFESDGSVGICVDSGETYSNTITLDSKNVFFVAHNNVETVSKDFVTSNLAYSSAKEAFDHFGLTGDISSLRKFGFNRAQNYLFSSSNKVNAIYSKLLSMTEKYERYDDGAYEGHIYYNSFNDKNANAFTYDDMSPYGLLTQLYDAVRNYNLSKDISDIFISMGASPVDYDKMSADIKSSDLDYFSIKNGNYYFVDVHRNFERTFGKYYDVVKPILDNFDRSKGNYARSIISKCKEASDLYAKYDFKPGSIEDKVIQLYGEGEGQFNLNKESDVLLFEKLGFSADAHSGEKTVTVPIDYQKVVNLFGDEKARQIDECVRFFKAQYDEYLGRVNDTISRIYPGQSHRLIQPRNDYFRHFREMGEGLRGFLNTLSSDIQIDPRLSGISERTKPKQSFESFRQERKGKKTDFSAIYGFVDYMLQAEYTINIDPNIKEFRELRQNLAEMKAERGEDNLNQFLKYLDNFANHLSKKTLMADRILMDYLGSFGRSFITGLSYLNDAAMKSAVMYNPAVAAKQILNLKNGIFYLQDPTLLINSVVGLCKSCTDTDLWSKYDSLFKQSNYLAERYLSRAFPSSKSNAGKIAEDFISFGDEFGCRAIWLAAHEDALRLGASDPIIYADDIARKCSAGRGIGEKPLAFSTQVTKMFLPFLLENNNNWNVLRDFYFNPVKSKNADDHQFSDDNSYLYYKNQKSTGKKIFGNSMRLAFYLLTTFAIGDLIEDLTGFRPEFDPVNDVVKGFSKAMRFNDGKFDAKVLVDGLLNSSKNLVWDFAEHRNFSSVYSAALSWVSDDPLESHVDIFGSVPVVSTLNNAAHSFKDGDVAGGVLNLAAGFVPGGGQIRKSIKGFGDVFQGGKYNEPFTKTIFGAKKGGKVYDVAKTPGNYAKAILFGPSSLPEAQKFYDEKEMNSEFSLFNKDKKDKQYSAFEKKFRKSGGAFEKEISRLQDELGSDNVIPYYYVEEEYEYKDSYGVSHTFALTGKERDKIQADVNNELYNEFKKVYSSEKFKNSDDSGKAKLLSDARIKIIGSYKDEIISKEKNRAIVDAYMYAHGKSDFANLYKKTGNIDVLPIYESSREKNFTSQGQNVSFELTDNQMSYYNKVGNEKLEQTFKEAMMSYDWLNLSDSEKVKRLQKARSKAEGIVSDYIKYDYLYKEHISEFDSKYGADNPIRKAYEYSHDPTVYPYWILDDSITFTHKGKSYTYNLKKEQGSYGDTSEYEAWTEYYNKTLQEKYTDIAIGRGYLDNKSDEEIYLLLVDYKKRIRSEILNVQMRNYAKAKLGIPY